MLLDAMIMIAMYQCHLQALRLAEQGAPLVQNMHPNALPNMRGVGGNKGTPMTHFVIARPQFAHGRAGEIESCCHEAQGEVSIKSLPELPWS